MSREKITVQLDLPEQLFMYVDDLRRTGLYGYKIENVCLECVRSEILRALGDKFIPIRSEDTEL